jgi:hypothetical protein
MIASLAEIRTALRNTVHSAERFGAEHEFPITLPYPQYLSRLPDYRRHGRLNSAGDYPSSGAALP